MDSAHAADSDIPIDFPEAHLQHDDNLGTSASTNSDTLLQDSNSRPSLSQDQQVNHCQAQTAESNGVPSSDLSEDAPMETETTDSQQSQNWIDLQSRVRSLHERTVQHRQLVETLRRREMELEIMVLRDQVASLRSQLTTGSDTLDLLGRRCDTVSRLVTAIQSAVNSGRQALQNDSGNSESTEQHGQEMERQGLGRSIQERQGHCQSAIADSSQINEALSQTTDGSTSEFHVGTHADEITADRDGATGNSRPWETLVRRSSSFVTQPSNEGGSHANDGVNSLNEFHGQRLPGLERREQVESSHRDESLPGSQLQEGLHQDQSEGDRLPHESEHQSASAENGINTESSSRSQQSPEELLEYRQQLMHRLASLRQRTAWVDDAIACLRNHRLAFRIPSFEWREGQQAHGSDRAQSVQSQLQDGSMLRIAGNQVYQVDASRDEAVMCTICQENLEDGCMATSLPCMHHYHTDCIRRWLSRRPSCPLCSEQVEWARV